MFNLHLFLLCLAVGILHGNVAAASDENKSTTVSLEAAATSTSLTPAISATTASVDSLTDATKDKRQVGAKDTQIYPNHRSANAEDDPEDGQETIYGPKPNQFLIRPLSPHQHQQHEEHEQQTQLRNYPVTIRPHSQQLLEQSQEIQHFAYLQDLTRNHPTSKSASGSATSQRQGKAHLKKVAAPRVAPPTTASEEAEQRYAYAVQAQVPQPQPHQFHQSPRYRVAAAAAAAQLPQPQQLQQQQLQPQQYQIIPEEQFLKILEEELQARAYQEEQVARQQHQQQQQQQQQHRGQQQQHQLQRQYQVQAAEAPRDSTNKIPLADGERSPQPGLGSYRQRIAIDPNDAYVQFIPRPHAAPKYLPEPQEPQPVEPTAPSGPPRLTFYTPQPLQYKALPNHPLAKSSLEKEIEKLLVANKNSADALQFEDNSNEPSAVVNHQQHHHQPPPLPPPQRHQPRPHPKAAFVSSTTPNAQLDANNQPFIPSLFQFSNYQQPTPIYATQAPQKLGPVVYPTSAPTSQPAQPSQYYYQEARPTPSLRPYRAKQYGNKIPTPPSSSLKVSREKESSKLQQKYSQPYDPNYDYARQPQAQTGPVQFYPSQRDPTDPQAQPSLRPTLAAQQHSEPPPQQQQPSPSPNYRPFLIPSAAPSQSSIFVSQGTGIKTPSRPIHKAGPPKTAEDVRQLHLPPPGGKPLTQAEFQALIDAGYPVTAVPVPVPVPYEQYIKENPEYRNQPIDYSLMRLAQQYVPQAQQSQHSQHRHHHHQQQQQRSLASPSEPAAKIVASPNEPKSATGIGGGGITYLRPIEHEAQQQSRRPRDEQDTAVEGVQKET